MAVRRLRCFGFGVGSFLDLVLGGVFGLVSSCCLLWFEVAVWVVEFAVGLV